MCEEDTQPKVNYINQLQYIIDTLRKNPDDRRLVTNLWNPAEIEKMALPPCHYGMQFFSRINKNGERVLDTTWTQRSCDMPIGIPYNVLQYTIINKLVAFATGHKPGRVQGVLGDCHIYENQIPMVEAMISRYDLGLVNECPEPFVSISDELLFKMHQNEHHMLELKDVALDGSDF